MAQRICGGGGGASQTYCWHWHARPLWCTEHRGPWSSRSPRALSQRDRQRGRGSTRQGLTSVQTGPRTPRASWSCSRREETVAGAGTAGTRGATGGLGTTGVHSQNDGIVKRAGIEGVDGVQPAGSECGSEGGQGGRVERLLWQVALHSHGSGVRTIFQQQQDAVTSSSRSHKLAEGGPKCDNLS